MRTNRPSSHALPSADIVTFPASRQGPDQTRTHEKDKRPHRGVALTKASVAKLALPAGKNDVIYFDSGLPNFGLRIRAGGKKTFIAQYRDEHGSTRRVTIGSANVLDPEQARAQARKILGGVAIGNDPAKVKRAARAATKLSDLIDPFLAYAEKKQRPLTFRETRRNLMNYCTPLASTPVKALDRATIAGLHERITARSGPVMANRVLASISMLLGWAMGKGYVDVNVAIGVPKNVEVARERVLTDAELKAIWAATGALSDYDRIVRLLMITGCRKSEIGNADWSEVSADGTKLAIAGSRMKNGEAHVVHLTALARTQLPERPASGEGKLFGKMGTGFGGWSKGKERVDRRSGVTGWGLHDLRRTMSTRMHEAGTAPHVIEAVLAHVSGHRAGVAGTYNRAVYESPKRNTLEQWSAIIGGIVGAVHEAP